MEDLLYNELRMRGFNVDVGGVTIAQKDPDGILITVPYEPLLD